MHLALDFDKTFTADPPFWAEFVNEAKTNGHKVWIVTVRDRDNDGINWAKVGLKHEPCPVIWCDGRPKYKVVKEQGVQIDIWIDDNPSSILLTTAFTSREQLADWRRTDGYRGSKLAITGESRGFEQKEKTNADNQSSKPAASPNGRSSSQGPADNNRRPRLLSRRPGGGGRGLSKGK